LRPNQLVGYESLDLLSRGIPQIGSAAGGGGVSPDKIGIELMLANQKAEAISKTSMTVLVTVGLRRGSGLLRVGRALRPRFPTKLLDGAEANAVSLPGARLTARVSVTRISAPRTREDTFEGLASPYATIPRRLLLLYTAALNTQHHKTRELAGH